MVVFILAAATAFLLCAPFSPKQLSDWLEEHKHALRLFLFACPLLALLLILVAVAATPYWFGAILLGLAIFTLASVLGSLLYAQAIKLEGLLCERATRLRLEKTLQGGDTLRAHEAESPGQLDHTAKPVRRDSGSPGDTAKLSGQPNQNRPSFGWLRFFMILILILIMVLLLLFLVIPIDFTGCRPGVASAFAIFSCQIDAWAYNILLTIDRVKLMPETTYTMLGIVAGLMCGNFRVWITYARSHGIGHTKEGAPETRTAKGDRVSIPRQSRGL